MTSEMPTEAQLNFTTFYNVIDGGLEDTDNKGRTTNPLTLEDNPEVPICTREDVDKAVKVAQRAAKQWAEVLWAERKKALESFAAAFESYSEDFARILTWEQGKPLLWAKNELDTAIKFLKGSCELSLPTETIESSEERKIVTHYLPLGVTVGIVPWNYPIFLASAKLGPALLAGNAFILKSSPFTPYSSLKMAELGMRFFPPGVFQALSGDDSLGPFLTAHPLVDMVSFTGSAPTGKEVMRACSQTLKRVTLELGGNDPAIVCADVDPATAASKIALFAFCNSGQMCMSVKRVYVHSSIYDQFLSTMVKYVESLKYGVDETSFIGPIGNKAHFERLKKLLTDAEETGLTFATGGLKSFPDEKGLFLPVTVVDNPPDNSAVVQLEQFGPVLPLLKWSDEADVIRRANNTNTGLGASVWTRDDAQATRLRNQLHSGNVWINTHAEIMPNTPFGGHKESGLGFEWGVEGLKAYCNIQSVYTRPFE